MVKNDTNEKSDKKKNEKFRENDDDDCVIPKGSPFKAKRQRIEDSEDESDNEIQKTINENDVVEKSCENDDENEIIDEEERTRQQLNQDLDLSEASDSETDDLQPQPKSSESKSSAEDNIGKKGFTIPKSLLNGATRNMCILSILTVSFTVTWI